MWKTYLRGELASAVSLASAAAGRNADRGKPWFWNLRLLQAEALAGLSRNDESAALLAEQVPAVAGLEQCEARRLIDLAAIRQNRTKEANDLLSAARTIVRDPELEIRIHLVQGQVWIRADKVDAEDEEFQAALDAAFRHGRKEYQALALNNLCYCRKSQGRYEEAAEFGGRALALAQESGALRTAAFAHNNLGSVYAYLGDFPAAFDHQQKAIDAFRAMNARSNLMTALGELGLTHDRSDEPEKAIANYRQAYDLAVELKAGGDAARHAENLALTLIKTKQWDAASEWNERAVRTAAARNLPYLTRNRALIALGRGDTGAAGAAARELLDAASTPAQIQWEAWELLGRIDANAKRYTAANRAFQRALAIVEGMRSDLVSAQYRVTLLSRMMSFYRSYVNVLVAQNDDPGALRVVESSRARVLAERLGRDFREGRPADPAALRNFSRGANALVLSFWMGPERSFAWLIAPAEIRRFELPRLSEVEPLVTAYRNVVEHSVQDPMAEPAARALWDKLLAPVAAAIPKGSRVIVVPDGPLHRLNLETLVAPAPAPHYWIEDVELAVSPSISIAMARRPETGTESSLLLIGAPDYKGSTYQPLPGAAAEVDQLRSRFKRAAVFTGAQAIPAAYRAAGPEKYSVIHFAAHAEANVEYPLDSAVVLSRSGEGFKLHARDVIDVPIRAELVTLSGCRSAGARSYAGEGLMGFAWAFLHAGAKAVVAGLWDVSDASTGLLMARFYDGVAAGNDPACALREGKLALAREGRYRRPFYWGAFQTYIASGY